MGLRVEHPLVQRNEGVLGEREVEVFEGLGQEEALLNVVLGGAGLVHVPDASVPPVRPTVPLQGLKVRTRSANITHSHKINSRFENI